MDMYSDGLHVIQVELVLQPLPQKILNQKRAPKHFVNSPKLTPCFIIICLRAKHQPAEMVTKALNQ